MDFQRLLPLELQRSRLLPPAIVQTYIQRFRPRANCVELFSTESVCCNIADLYFNSSVRCDAFTIALHKPMLHAV